MAKQFVFRGRMTQKSELESATTRKGEELRKWSFILEEIDDNNDPVERGASIALTYMRAGDNAKYPEMAFNKYQVGQKLYVRFNMRANEYTNKKGKTMFIQNNNVFEIRAVESHHNPPTSQGAGFQNPEDDLPF